jgi:ketosteroid isomerase-like protein
MGRYTFAGTLTSFAVRVAATCVASCAVMLAPSATQAQETPLEHCGALPVIEVMAAGHSTRFLIDTAATSMLNLKSFAQGETRRDVQVTSWSGTTATSAREVTLSELKVGHIKIIAVKLPAIDLSAIGNACGRTIDGILGVDLLGKLGATIDLKRQTVHFGDADANDARGSQLESEMHRDIDRCLSAFNSADEDAFAECLDPKIVLFSADADLYGREAAMTYFRESYFHHTPAARLNIRASSFHAIGEAVWYEYDFTIDQAPTSLRGRGMAMCRKSDGHWRVASMHHSLIEAEPSPVGASVEANGAKRNRSTLKRGAE